MRDGLDLVPRDSHRNTFRQIPLNVFQERVSCRSSQVLELHHAVVGPVFVLCAVLLLNKDRRQQCPLFDSAPVLPSVTNISLLVVMETTG